MDDELNIAGAETTSVSEVTNVGDIPLIDKNKVKQLEEAEAAQALKEESKHKNCPRCGHDQALPVLSVTDEDKAAFLKSILGDTPYTKTIKTFHGHVEVLLESSPTWMTNLVREQLTMEHKKRTVNNADEYRAMLFKYYMVSNLKELKVGDNIVYTRGEDIMSLDNITARGPNGDTMLVSYSMRFDLWTDAQLTAVLEAVATFQGMVELMTRQASSPDFWKSVTVD